MNGDRARDEQPRPPRSLAGATEGLLAALTLAPGTWSRNKFFELYKDPKMQGIRRRAGLLRGIVRHLARGAVEALSERQDPVSGDWLLEYRVPDLNLSRTVRLSPFERAVLRVTLARAKGEWATEPWKSAVDDALAKLGTKSA